MVCHRHHSRPILPRNQWRGCGYNFKNASCVVTVPSSVKLPPGFVVDGVRCWLKTGHVPFVTKRPSLNRWRIAVTVEINRERDVGNAIVGRGVLEPLPVKWPRVQQHTPFHLVNVPSARHNENDCMFLPCFAINHR